MNNNDSLEDILKDLPMDDIMKEPAPEATAAPSGDVAGATQRIYVDPRSRTSTANPAAATAPQRPAPVRRAPTAQQRAAAARKRKQQRIAIIVLIAVAAVLLLTAAIIGIVSLVSSPADNGLILNNVYAAGVNLGGMTKDQAKSALHKATDNTYSQLDMTVTVLDTTIVLAAKDTGATLNVDAVVDAAYDYGRSGSRSENKKAQNAANTSSHTISILPYLTIDSGYIQDAVNDLGDLYSTTLKQSTYTVNGERPPMEQETYDTGKVFQTLIVSIGTAEYGMSTDDLYQQIMEAYNINLFQVTGECSMTAPDALDSEEIWTQAGCIAPVDAQYDTDTYETTKEVYGYGFTLEALQTAINNAAYGDVIEIPMTFIKPELTEADFSGKMFQDTLATYQTSLSTNDAWNSNMKLAVKALDGVIIKVGDTFSFNDTLGAVTTKNGYKSAESFVGKSSQNVVGGGICQVATTLYNCVLLADLDIVEHSTHSYAPDYVTVGFDAEIISGSVDFKFRNSTAQPIRIQASIENGKVRIILLGTDEDSYTTKISYKITNTEAPDTVYNTMYADNVGGYVDGDVLADGIPGYTVAIYRTSYNGGQMISEEKIAEYVYAKRDKVMIRIGTPETPDNPTTDTSGSTGGSSESTDGTTDTTTQESTATSIPSTEETTGTAETTSET